MTGKLVTLLGVVLFVAGCGGNDGESLGPDQQDGTAPDVGEEVQADVGEFLDLAKFLDVPADVVPADLDVGDDIETTNVVPDIDEPDILVEINPGVEFDRFCLNDPWDSATEAVVLHELGGPYLGVYNQFPALTLETMKVVPQHSFHVRKILAAFAGSGKVRIRLMTTFGRSYPGNYPDVSEPEANVMEPIDIVLEDAQPEEWVEVDVAHHGIFLEPTQHYMIVYQHWDVEPFLAIEELVGEEDYSRGLILVPGNFEPYGVEGNYRMKLEGDYFCKWDEADFWTEKQSEQPFYIDGSDRPAIADMNGDGHDDLVAGRGGPVLFLGDGTGSFEEDESDGLFPADLQPGMTVLGDFDNDGMPDIFVATWVGVDGDGDGFTILDGDCHDQDAGANPDAEEIPGNGLDDDCDGLVDDGEDTADSDADGFSIADGDCDDTRETVFPGNAEAKDSLDNDCDGEADEDFVNSVWLNNWPEPFSRVEDSGIETLDPTGAAALGDGNGDGVLDVYWGNWLKHYPDAPAVMDRYAVGHGDGTFTDMTVDAGMVPEEDQPCYGVTWVDYNNDGLQDVWVGNYQFKPNYLFENQGDGTFVDRAEDLGLLKDDKGFWGGHTYGGDWADFDNDGDMDLFEPNLSHPRTMPYSDDSRLLVNQGPPGYEFIDKFDALGFTYDEGDVNAAFADFDNDMDLDLVISSLYQGHYSKFYRNDGAQGFVDITYETGTAVHDATGAVWADVDEDGDLDLFINDRRGKNRLQLFLNRVGQDNNWVELVLVGTQSNRGAVGARVSLTAAGITQMREIKGGGRHSNAQDSAVVHFGLADNDTIDEVVVRWPGGELQTLDAVIANTRHHVVEPE